MGSPSRRRWYQFSVLSLLVVTTAMALLFAFVVGPAWRQRSAVATILELGGQVSYDYQQSGGSAPAGPAWLRKMIGDDCFQTATSVALLGPAFDESQKIEEALQAAAKLPQIESIAIHAAGLVDGHLEQLSEMRSLDHLSLSGPKVTSHGIEHLTQMPHLASLSLAAPIDDAGLSSLAGLAELRRLELFGPVTDAGMVHLDGLEHLEVLLCNNGRVSYELDEKTEFEFGNLSPKDAIDYFGTVFDIPWRVDDAAIAAAGIPFDTLAITDAAKGITFREALRRILEPAALGFRIDNDRLVITTRDEAERAHAGINNLRQKLPKLQEVKVGW
jgi:hypothetical protein